MDAQPGGILYLQSFFRYPVTVNAPAVPGRLLYQYSVTMVNLMLNNLSRPTGECLDPGLKLFILPLNFHALVPFAGTRSAQEGKTAFFGIVRS